MTLRKDATTITTSNIVEARCCSCTDRLPIMDSRPPPSSLAPDWSSVTVPHVVPWMSPPSSRPGTGHSRNFSASQDHTGLTGHTGEADVRRSKRPKSTKIRRLTRHQPGVSALRPAVAGNSLALPGHHTPTLEKLEEICGRLRGRPMPPLKSKAFGRHCVTTLTQYDVGTRQMHINLL